MLLIDLALTASVQIIFIYFNHLKADVEIVLRYYPTIHTIRVDMKVCMSACKRSPVHGFRVNGNVM